MREVREGTGRRRGRGLGEEGELAELRISIMAALAIGAVALAAAAGGADAREVAFGPRFSEIRKMPGHDRPESFQLPRPQE